MRSMLPLTLLVLGGCGLFDRVKDAVNPVVAFGTVAVVEPPETDLIDMSQFEGMASGVGVVLFLADALNAADIDTAPVSGAIVTVEGCGASVDATEEEAGAYVILPGTTDLDGCDGGTMSLTLDRDNGKEPGLITFDMPVLGGLAVPEEHDPNTDMAVPFREPAPDRVLSTVIDVSSGDVTFVDRPETVREWFDFVRGAPMSELTLPGAAFPDETVYGVAVTRLKKVPELGFDRINSSLSTISVGQAALYPVITGEIPEDTGAP